MAGRHLYKDMRQPTDPTAKKEEKRNKFGTMEGRLCIPSARDAQNPTIDKAERRLLSSAAECHKKHLLLLFMKARTRQGI